MSLARKPGDTHVQVLVSGVPADLLRWFDQEMYRQSGGKRGGHTLGTGRSGMIVRAMEQYRSDRKRRAHQNRERKAEKKVEA